MALLEDLPDPADDPTAWTFSPWASIVGGRTQLQSRLDPDVTTVTSVAAGDLTGSRLQLETVTAPATGVSHELTVSLYTDTPTGNALEWKVSPAFPLEAAVRVGGVRTVLATPPRDAFAQRWLRIVHGGGLVSWETSPDGLVWVQLATWAPTFAITALTVRAASSYWAAGDVAGAWLLDNVNTDPGAGDRVTITGDEGLPYLAVDVQPDVAFGVFTLDSSDLDGPDVLAWSDTDPGAWLSIVCDVTGVAMRRGATRLSGVVAKADAGTATITLSDTSGMFDPMSNGGAIHKGVPVRLRAWGTDVDGARWDAVLFTCEVDQVFVQYQPADAPVVTLTVVDLVGPLNGWESTGEPEPGVGAGEDLGARADRLLTAVGRGVVSPRSDRMFTATLAPTAVAKPWTELQDAQQAELGRVWVDRYNRLVLQQRNSQLSGPVRGTISDVHGQTVTGVHVCAADATVVFGVELMANLAIGARVPVGTGDLPVTMTAADDTSIARYGRGTTTDRALLLQTDAQVAEWVARVVADQSTPELRVDSVTPAPPSWDLETALHAWPAVCSTDIGDRWVFLFHPQQGPTVEQTVGVVGIELDATPDGWTVRWATAAAPGPGSPATGGLFTLDTSTLDGGDVLVVDAVSV
jgi:hypothetical protein